MFQNDRFGPDEDYHAIYKEIGGKRFDANEIHRLVDLVYDFMLYSSRTSEAAFPTVAEAARQIAPELELSSEDLQLLDDIIAIQEIGRISGSHRDLFHELRRSHQLGIVSNVWASSGRFEQNLIHAGIRDCFQIRVWSSDYGCIKPTPELYRIALNHFEISPSDVVYVGDHPRRDVDGSKALGMGAVWVDNPERKRDAGSFSPDLTVRDIGELLLR